MFNSRARVLTSLFIFVATIILKPAVGAGGTTIRGWVSDEGCARGRASSGTYTGTNPDCARQCVAKGAKIVLILPEQKRLLVVENQEAVRANIGNFVEVNGTVDDHAGTIHVDTMKLVTIGRAMCDLPKKSAN
jgi:hypothetical protein